ncbi:hypothetical protein IKE07_02585 [Candidatus Saccharibacteria bacterium]|nr:hypothetical protein [Candidatus Saccharibacteria bacterium]
MAEKIESLKTPEKSNRAETERIIGAMALAAIGYEGRHKEIVESSFDKAREKGEALPEVNNLRRNYAYLSRIENLVEKYGNTAEKRLWDLSADKLIVKPENITDNYWRFQEQILRDNGQGRELSDYEKQLLINDIQDNQRKSLESWSSYLGDENSPYPMWFKIYAWDGMSKMGVFDKEKGYFSKRDKSTVAPYPKLNSAVLAKTYGAVADFYGIKGEERYEENQERNEILKALAASGNFNKLYSKILLSEKAIPKTPERTEDVHGEWLEYLPGEEEKLASAAEGTPWCVADPGTGRNYLEYGNSTGQGNGYDEDDYDTNEYRQNQAKFILFHLYDPEKNTLSESACASIRLGPDGEVAEISGLDEGQALEDSLVPIVEEKTKSLPGGERYLEKFADRKELIKLDHKMQDGEDLTLDELNFLYEINRPINVLDTYNEEDPRIQELRETFDVDYALEKGVDGRQLVQKLSIYDLIRNTETFIKHHIDFEIDADRLVDELEEDDIKRNIDKLVNGGAELDSVIERLKTHMDTETIDLLLKYDADIYDLIDSIPTYELLEDVRGYVERGVSTEYLSKQFSEYDQKHELLEKIDLLTNLGIKVDINEILSECNASSRELSEHLEAIVSQGYDIAKGIWRFNDNDIISNAGLFMEHGLDKTSLEGIIRHADKYAIAEHIDELLKCEVDEQLIVKRLDGSYLVRYYDQIGHAVNKSFEEVASNYLQHLGLYHMDKRAVEAMKEHGLGVDWIIETMPKSDRATYEEKIKEVYN